jgi:D-alanyl-lipoteichoic acid acyltransferase DltB (MBOAT superfamily)
VSFVSLSFLVFLPVVVTVRWALRDRRLRNAWLVLASAVFYGWAVPWLPLLLGVSVVLDYAVARGMGRWPERRRGLLALSLAGNLGMLGVFKYADLFGDAVAAAAGLAGHPAEPWRAGLLLPAGISFFTFQSMSYTIDVYRGRLKPRESLLDVATFVCLFPQLVAGPIERARDLLPQVEADVRFSRARLRSGAALALWGATQKVVVADTLALYVDRAYSMEGASPALLWAATAAFAVQILADFSGYTDIARGTARMMGFDLRENFHAPYAARSLGDFWRRWHTSFTSWMHDYLYRPLRGAGGPARAAAAAAATLVLAGLWHGGSARFAAWGAWFAVSLLGWRAVAATLPPGLRQHRLAPALTIPLTQSIVLVGMLIFRAPTLAFAADVLRQPPWVAAPGHAVLALTVMGVTAWGGGLLAVGGALRRRASLAGGGAGRALLRGALAGAGVWAVATFARDTARDFLYFAF